MKPTKKEDITIESNVQTSKSIEMTIDPDATEHIIALLTDLYSDPEKAIIREVSTNAWDSHVAAGQTRPIEVTTPTWLSPTFIVQDWGVGLNAQDFEHIYSSYGKSTKRETNTQTGSLGLGCKSPLTYTSQFTVVGVKDGIKTSVLISRDENGIPTLDIVDESETDEPNGCKVVIATKAHDGLLGKAQKFFKYWPEGQVLLNGEEPEHVIDLMKVTDHVRITNSGNRYTQSNGYVLMCNVAYPLDREYYDELLNPGQMLILDVDPGEVHFVPSREALNYTTRTKRVITDLLGEYRGIVIKNAQSLIDACGTRHEALTKYWELQNKLRVFKGAKATYKGEDFPDLLAPPKHDDNNLQWPFHIQGAYGWGSSKALVHQHIPCASLSKVVFITGFTRANPTAHTQKKVVQYLKEQGGPDLTTGSREFDSFVYCLGTPDTKWLNPKHIYNWEDVSQVKLPRQVSSDGDKHSMAGSYTIYDLTGKCYRNKPVEDIDPDVPLFYAQNANEQYKTRTMLLNMDLYEDAQIALVYINRKDKFKRLFPQARTIDEVVQEVFTIWWNTLSPKDRNKLLVDDSTTFPCDAVNLGQIADPTLRRYVAMKKYKLPPHIDKQAKLFKNQLGQWDMTGCKYVKKMPKIDKRYPLVSNCWKYIYYDHEKKSARLHSTIYCNAIYQELYAND